MKKTSVCVEDNLAIAILILLKALSIIAQFVRQDIDKNRSNAPMDFEKLFQMSPKMNDVLSVYQQTYQLNPEYQTSGDSNNLIWLEDRITPCQNAGVFGLI